MMFLEEKDGVYVFGCQGCKDVNKRLSVRMVSSAAMKRAVRGQLRKEGRLLTGPPPVRHPQMQGQRRTRAISEWDAEHRRSKDGRYELVQYRTLSDGNIQVQMAVDGKLAPMMDDHIASREEYPSDVAYFSRVAESSELMIHLYGDARHPLSDDEIQQRQQMTF